MCSCLGDTISLQTNTHTPGERETLDNLLPSLPLSSSESSLIPNSFLSLSVRLSGFSLLGVSVDLRLMRSDEPELGKDKNVITSRLNKLLIYKNIIKKFNLKILKINKLQDATQ